LAKHRGPRIYPDINFSMLALERIICMDSEQQKQADMRGFGEPEEVKVEKAPQPEQEEVLDQTSEEMDEDAVVDLLIQQHRLQEQAERSDEGSGGEDLALVIPTEYTEAELEKIKADFAEADAKEDGLLGDDAPAPVKKESVKVEEIVAVLEDELLEEEKDEFTLALEGILVEPKEGEVVIGVEPTESTTSTTGPRKDRVEGSKALDESKDTLLGPKETSKRPEDESSKSTDVYEKLYQMDGPADEGGIASGIRSQWDGKAERASDIQEQLEEDKACEETIEEEKLNLPQAGEEDEAIVVEPRVPKPMSRVQKEIIPKIGLEFAELAAATAAAAEAGVVATESTVTVDESRTQIVENAEETKVEEEEVDDLSDVSTIEEDSRLSDHKGLEDDTKSSSTSTSEEDNAASYRDLITISSSVSKLGGKLESFEELGIAILTNII
jgi:hypothetical protein